MQTWEHGQEAQLYCCVSLGDAQRGDRNGHRQLWPSGNSLGEGSGRLGLCYLPLRDPLTVPRDILTGKTWIV